MNWLGYLGLAVAVLVGLSLCGGLGAFIALIHRWATVGNF